MDVGGLATVSGSLTVYSEDLNSSSAGGSSVSAILTITQVRVSHLYVEVLTTNQSPEVRVSHLYAEVLQAAGPRLFSGSAGLGSISNPQLVAISSDALQGTLILGGSAVTGQIVSELHGSSTGSAGVEGGQNLLGGIPLVGFEVPYLLGLGGTFIASAAALSYGIGSVVGTLAPTHEARGLIAGRAFVGGSPIDLLSLHYWRLDEPGGSTLAADSGIATHVPLTLPVGTPMGNLGVYDTTGMGPITSSAQYGIDTSSSFYKIDTFTISAWVMTTATGVLQFVIDTSNNYADDSWFLLVGTDNRPRFEKRASGLKSVVGGVLDTGVWYHLVGVSTPTSLALYVDGALADSLTHATASISYSGTRFKVGGQAKSPSQSSRYWRGYIDEVRWWDSEVDIDEIRKLGTPLDVSGPSFLSGMIGGSAEVTGLLSVGQFEDGRFVIELSGTSAGSSSVGGLLSLPMYRPRFLYLTVNVGVGFYPTDIYPGPGVIAQFFPDGDTRDDFARFLYLLLNVGVGFDDYDDVSDRDDFVSQVFPDGHLRDDFARFLYLYLQVIRGRGPQHKLAILPSYADPHEFVPRPTPPTNKLT
jgi:hypothetical protein